MITTTAHSIKRGGSCAAFTLTEVLIAASLSMVLFGAIFSSFIFMGRSTLSIANYSAMNAQSRGGLEVFGRDVRSAENVLAGFSASEFTIEIPGEGWVTYLFRAKEQDRPLIRKDSSGERTIMTGVEELTFRYFDLQADSATVPVQVKQIQLSLKLVRQASVLENTEKVVSARFILRNKRVSN